jgi:hypothetical protein
MYNPDAGLIFPPCAISSLHKERGVAWQDLVAFVEKTIPDGIEQMAFILMIARLCNCATCNADSLRALRGCISCSKQSINRFHGSDEELTRLFENARNDVLIFTKRKYLRNFLIPENPSI